MSKQIPGLSKTLSPLVMGVDNQTTLEGASRMFDDYIARGGKVFDTAYVYGRGECEKVFGEWLRQSGLREQVVLIGKGAHTPYCNPEDLGKQLLESLGRLQITGVDIYMMHRDNPEIPAGEFVEVLNQHKNAGRMAVFGGSNWSLRRVQEANDYAKAKGLQGFSVVSNNLSLAQMVDAPWAGCLSSHDAEYRAWLRASQTALLPWSSQGRGFFVKGNPDDLSDSELVRCWYSPDNFERLQRARQLAASRGVQPIQIALAWVLHQSFPTFPLIGPRSTEETESSFKALEIVLTPDEVKWLNLEG